MQRITTRVCGDGYVRADNGSLSPLSIKTANYTMTHHDYGKTFSNRGAAGAVTLTLPSDAKSGFCFRIFKVVAQNVALTATGGKKINGGSADGTLTLTAATGVFLVATDGTDWLCTQESSATLAGLEQGTDGQLIIGQTSADAAYKDVTGDATIDKDGVVAVVKFGVSPKGTVVAHSGNATLDASGFGKIHTNTGATGGTTLTMPAAATVEGLSIKVQMTAAQTLQIIPAAGEKVYLGGSGVADKYCQIAGVIGNFADVYCDGTDFMIVNYSGVLTKQA